MFTFAQIPAWWSILSFKKADNKHMFINIHDCINPLIRKQLFKNTNPIFFILLEFDIVLRKCLRTHKKDALALEEAK